MRDEGRRVLQTKASGGPHGGPRQLETRAAKVTQALMAVVDIVDRGHVVDFDSYNKETGIETEFVRREGGWDMTLDLEAPEIANIVNKEYLAQITTEAVPKVKGVTIVVQMPKREDSPEGDKAEKEPQGPFQRR